jgi:hypothetical protein
MAFIVFSLNGVEIDRSLTYYRFFQRSLEIEREIIARGGTEPGMPSAGRGKRPDLKKFPVLKSPAPI